MDLDPFSIDFECPFDKVDYEEIIGKKKKKFMNFDYDFSFGDSKEITN